MGGRLLLVRIKSLGSKDLFCTRFAIDLTIVPGVVTYLLVLVCIASLLSCTLQKKEKRKMLVSILNNRMIYLNRNS